MKRKEAMYRINLEDCSAASFTSLSKPYYGSLDEIRELLSTIRDDPQMQGCCTEVLNAFSISTRKADAELCISLLTKKYHFWSEFRYLESVNSLFLIILGST